MSSSKRKNLVSSKKSKSIFLLMNFFDGDHKHFHFYWWVHLAPLVVVSEGKNTILGKPRNKHRTSLLKFVCLSWSRTQILKEKNLIQVLLNWCSNKLPTWKRIEYHTCTYFTHVISILKKISLLVIFGWVRKV